MNAVEVVARALARMGPDEDWPESEGDLSDEYKRWMELDAARVLGALVEWFEEGVYAPGECQGVEAILADLKEGL